jgi:hypothetical protein
VILQKNLSIGRNQTFNSLACYQNRKFQYSFWKIINRTTNVAPKHSLEETIYDQISIKAIQVEYTAAIPDAKAKTSCSTFHSTNFINNSLVFGVTYNGCKYLSFLRQEARISSASSKQNLTLGIWY